MTATNFLLEKNIIYVVNTIFLAERNEKLNIYDV